MPSDSINVLFSALQRNKIFVKRGYYCEKRGWKSSKTKKFFFAQIQHAFIQCIGINLIIPDFVFYSFLFFAFFWQKFDTSCLLWLCFVSVCQISKIASHGGHLTWGLVVSSVLWSVHGPGPSAHVTMSKHVIINSLVKLQSRSCSIRNALSSSGPGNVQVVMSSWGQGISVLSSSSPGYVQAVPVMYCQAPVQVKSKQR